MARYTGAKCKLCRREGTKLFLKGDRCYTGKCAIDRRSYAPGQHGQGRKKPSDYSTQMRAKQAAKRYYGVSESQFHKYYMMATKVGGKTGENLLRLCEQRLDNVVHLLGWGASRAQARQLVNHGHFLVNGKKVDIASYLLAAGDVISIKEKSRESEVFKQLLEAGNARPVPAWLERAAQGAEGRVLVLPTRDQIHVPVEEHLIVEFYSK